MSNLSDNYMSYDLANWYRSQMQQRAPGTTAAQADISYNFDNTYKCEQYALLVQAWCLGNTIEVVSDFKNKYLYHIELETKVSKGNHLKHFVLYFI
ncbi:hypothetical protein Psal006a_03470 (plasmid) [Piscirickettsia salmonis]|nr:hypothetical protein Psal006a_03470 [Piscirickettsia salmonis]